MDRYGASWSSEGIGIISFRTKPSVKNARIGNRCVGGGVAESAMLRRDIFGDDSTCADDDVVTDLNIAKQASASTYEDSVPDYGCLFTYYPRSECPVADGHVLKDGGIALEHCLPVDDDAESVMHKPYAVIHYDLWREIAGVPSAQPAPNDLRGLGVSTVMQAIGDTPHSVIASVH
jgi:hypothetical protein